MIRGFEVVIGIETHAQLSTRSKIFRPSKDLAIPSATSSFLVLRPDAEKSMPAEGSAARSRSRTS